jgi:hypothetical protein
MGCDVDDLQRVAQAGDRPALECGGPELAGEVPVTEDPGRGEGLARGGQPPVYFHPCAALLVYERHAVMVGVVELPGQLRLLPVAELAQEGFDPGDGGLLNQQIEVGHRPQMGGRVVLLGDGNALQESDRRGAAPARIKDFTRRIESLAAE